MSYPKAVRDGPFVRFDGWDVPGHDVGQYFKNLTEDAKITALKEATLQYGARFFAFNTSGWCKSWTTIKPSKFVCASNSSLYVRVEYPGWVFYPGKPNRNILRSMSVTRKWNCNAEFYVQGRIPLVTT